MLGELLARCGAGQHASNALLSAVLQAEKIITPGFIGTRDRIEGDAFTKTGGELRARIGNQNFLNPLALLISGVWCGLVNWFAGSFSNAAKRFWRWLLYGRDGVEEGDVYLHKKPEVITFFRERKLGSWQCRHFLLIKVFSLHCIKPNKL